MWPVWVEVRENGASSASLLPPLLYSQPLDAHRWNGSVRARGLRPLYLRADNTDGRAGEVHALYPFFSYRRLAEGHRWSVFSLVNHYSLPGSPGGAGHRGLDLWPFYFSRETGSADSSYHAVLPLYGSVPNRFGQDRLTWVGFPLYARWEKNKVTTTTAPWPFIKVLHGEGNRGFEFWPLFGFRSKDGAYREQFYLWPLIYRRETERWEAQSFVKQGFLPFYAEARSRDFESRSFLWPFFGYTRRNAPYRYHEIDYLWPVWVQGRGDDRYVNRWGPFYTHSIVKGVDKTWVAWPVWRTQRWRDGGLAHRRQQVLYFLYYSTQQRSLANAAVPPAHKTHLWPLVSIWDNGAGRRQVQALSPLEVFFPGNDVVRLNYTPLFALYRYDRSAPGTAHHSLLWNLVSHRREGADREFHLGPLFSRSRNAEGTRLAVGAGLLSFSRTPGTRWRLRMFDFRRRSAAPPSPSPAP